MASENFDTSAAVRRKPADHRWQKRVARHWGLRHHLFTPCALQDGKRPVHTLRASRGLELLVELRIHWLGCRALLDIAEGVCEVFFVDIGALGRHVKEATSKCPSAVVQRGMGHGDVEKVESHVRQGLC